MQLLRVKNESIEWNEPPRNALLDEKVELTVSIFEDSKRIAPPYMFYSLLL